MRSLEDDSCHSEDDVVLVGKIAGACAGKEQQFRHDASVIGSAHKIGPPILPESMNAPLCKL